MVRHDDEESDADAITKEYLTAEDVKSRTKNLDYREGNIEYQLFLRQFNEYRLNKDSSDHKISKFNFDKKSIDIT